eukprot:m.541270 g.541270  ORF g.541270 m.541270 type:complete len:81 (+) comp22107_c0_seq1:249-491(+)
MAGIRPTTNSSGGAMRIFHAHMMFAELLFSDPPRNKKTVACPLTTHAWLGFCGCQAVVNGPHPPNGMLKPTRVPNLTCVS